MDIDAHDSREQRCRMLGHAVPFGYCRQLPEGRPCRLIVDCWQGLLDVHAFLAAPDGQMPHAVGVRNAEHHVGEDRQPELVADLRGADVLLPGGALAHPLQHSVGERLEPDADYLEPGVAHGGDHLGVPADHVGARCRPPPDTAMDEPSSVQPVAQLLDPAGPDHELVVVEDQAAEPVAPVKLLHFGAAHTAGDTVVVYQQSRVIPAGDLFFHGLPPYIDVADGADTANWVRTIEKLADDYPEYKVIPGHGPVTDMKAWKDFGAYLKYLREQVAAAVRAGKNKEEAQRSIDLSRFQHIQDQGEFLTKRNNIGWIYDELTKK